MFNSVLRKQVGRVTFLLSSLLVAALCGGALYLLRSHAESHRALLAVGYSLILLGVFWIRSLEGRLLDAGLPDWTFWPYFLIVFTGCLAALALKYTSGKETLALFLLLQLPAVLFQSAPAMAGLSSFPKKKPARPVTPIASFEFTVHLFLIANLWEVLHLLRIDVNGMAKAQTMQHIMDLGSGLLCLLWFISARGRLKALGRTRWTSAFCAVVLVPCLLLIEFRVLSFPLTLVLFVALQIPVLLIRRESISARFLPVDKDS